MKNIIRVCAFVFALLSVQAFGTPQPGLWWNPAEDGRGYGIDVQGDTMVVTTYAYGNSGQMQWYISAGKITNNGTQFFGTLLKVNNGQCLSCSWTGAPTVVGDDGNISISFSSRTTGTLTLPSGRQTAIQRQNFGVGGPPDSLLGDWLYAYTIGTLTFAERFRYTTKAGATSTGNGIVIDTTGYGSAEYQVSGAFAGRVFAIHTNSTVTQTLDVYIYTPYLEEGRGSWVSQSTGSQYGLNAYKTAILSGLAKAAATSRADAPSLAASKEQSALAASLAGIASQAKRSAEMADGGSVGW
jgi:hypothetical protein